jgi:hypothetical protein
MVGCSGSPEDLPPEGTGLERTARDETSTTTPSESDGGSQPCTSFDTRECVIDLGVVNGVHNCTKGRQICENGAWAACASF